MLKIKRCGEEGEKINLTITQRKITQLLSPSGLLLFFDNKINHTTLGTIFSSTKSQTFPPALKVAKPLFLVVIQHLY